MELKHRNYSLVPIILIACLLGGVLIWLWSGLLGLAGQNGALSLQIRELEAKQSRFSGSRLELAKTQEVLAVLSHYVVFSDRQVVMISDLEAIAKQSGIAYSLNNAVQTDKMTLDMNIGGSYRNVFHFLKLLETIGYWVSFDRLALNRGALDKQAVWSGNIVVGIPAVK